MSFTPNSQSDSKSPIQPAALGSSGGRGQREDPQESALYKEFLAEREEILRHKWIESEKAGHDIGFEKALLDWIVRFRASWRQQRKEGVPFTKAG